MPATSSLLSIGDVGLIRGIERLLPLEDAGGLGFDGVVGLILVGVVGLMRTAGILCFLFATWFISMVPAAAPLSSFNIN